MFTRFIRLKHASQWFDHSSGKAYWQRCQQTMAKPAALQNGGVGLRIACHQPPDASPQAFGSGRWIDTQLRSPDGVDGDLIFSFSDWPLQACSLDILLLDHLLEFATDSGALLHDAANSLAYDGKLIICGFYPLRHIRGWKGAWKRGTHEKRFRRSFPGKLKSQLCQLGFKVERLFDVPGGVRSPMGLHAMAQKLPIFLQPLTSALLNTGFIIVARKSGLDLILDGPVKSKVAISGSATSLGISRNAPDA